MIQGTCTHRGFTNVIVADLHQLSERANAKIEAAEVKEIGARCP
jgi:hypothetical protein